MNDWNQYLLAEVCHNITDGKHGDCKPEPGSGYYFLSAKDVIDGKVNYVGAREITEEDFLESHKRTRLEANDILITNSGTIGRIAIIRDSPLTSRSTFQKSVAIIKPKAETVDSPYLYYYLTARKQSLVDSAGGTTQQNLLLKDLRNFKVRVPPLDEQKAIAKILSSLDDKIELNRRMNATLEAMARALFKAWFVDFEPVHANKENRPSTSASPEIAKLFPSDFENGIPKGWEEKSLDGIADFLNGLALQKYPAESESEFLPVIKIAQLRKGNTEGSDRASKHLRPEYIVHDGDVLFSWSGSLEVEIWSGGDGALNQHLFKVTSENYPKWFYFLWTRFHLPDFRETAAHKATTMGHIQRYHLRDAKVVAPNGELLDEMDSVFRPLIDRMVVNSLEGRSLSEIRDSLLPKLISGQMSVSNL